MGALIQKYNTTLETEQSDPEGAIEQYLKELIMVDAVESQDFKENQVAKFLFLAGYILGFIYDLTLVGQMSIGWAITMMVFAPFIQGFLAVVLFTGIVSRFHRVGKTTNSEKYWVALFARIGAARCAIMLHRHGVVQEQTPLIKQFGGPLCGTLSEGLLALAHRWSRLLDDNVEEITEDLRALIVVPKNVCGSCHRIHGTHPAIDGPAKDHRR